MISCVALERPGKWRALSVTILLLVAALPAAPLLWRALRSMDSLTASGGAVVGSAFVSALRNSVVVALLVAVVSLAVGLPAGVLAPLLR